MRSVRRRILFYGTPDFALPTLDALLERATRSSPP